MRFYQPPVQVIVTKGILPIGRPLSPLPLPYIPRTVRPQPPSTLVILLGYERLA